MIKKIASSALATCLVLTLFSGCNTIKSVVADTVKANTDPSNQIAQTIPEASKDFPRGTWEADVYTNDLVGYKYTLPQAWEASSDEAIAELLGVSADVLSDEDKWAIESAKMTSVYDMMAQDPTSGNNVIVLFENLLLSAGTTDFTAEEYLEATTDLLKNTMNLDYSFDNTYDVTIAGDTYVVMSCTENSAGFSQYYITRKVDIYMECIVLTIVDNTKIDDILAQFTNK